MIIGEKFKICKCGCGEWITWKPQYQYSSTPKTIFISGHNPPWNKGLTKESDERVKINSKKAGITLHRMYMEGKINPYSHWKGKKLSAKHKIKISKGNVGKKMSQESKNKIRKKVLERINKGVFYYNSKNARSNQRRSETMKRRFIDNPHLMRGKNHPCYIDGRSWEVYPKIFHKIKILIRERDNYTCQLCNNPGKDVHHIDHNKQNNVELNLITLCRSCHMKERFSQYVTNFILQIILLEKIE